ncbi:MAG: cyclic nucleotide-binding domain-containing protein [Brevinematales bacterium]|nr:cyclic nucleotide-binding domain-containing protein [Brevinematales bacterium]
MKMKIPDDAAVRQLSTDIGTMLLFKHMTMGEKLEFIGMSEIVKFDKDEPVISEGQVEPFLYVVLDGAAQVMKKRDGKSVYISTLGMGDLFGEASIFVKVPRTAEILAGDNLKVLRIDRKKLLSFLFSHSDSGIKFLMIMIYGLLEKLHEANTDLSFDRKSFISQESIDLLLQDLKQ